MLGCARCNTYLSFRSAAILAIIIALLHMTLVALSGTERSFLVIGDGFVTLTSGLAAVALFCTGCRSIEAASNLPGPECEIFIAQLGGAMARVKPADTAFVGRDARFIMNLHGRCSAAHDDERVRAWARKAFAQAAPHATGSGYVNFLTDDEAERVSASYGSNYARLQSLKRRFDRSLPRAPPAFQLQEVFVDKAALRL